MTDIKSTDIKSTDIKSTDTKDNKAGHYWRVYYKITSCVTKYTGLDKTVTSGFIAGSSGIYSKYQNTPQNEIIDKALREGIDIFREIYNLLPHGYEKAVKTHIVYVGEFDDCSPKTITESLKKVEPKVTKYKVTLRKSYYDNLYCDYIDDNTPIKITVTAQYPNAHKQADFLELIGETIGIPKAEGYAVENIEPIN